MNTETTPRQVCLAIEATNRWLVAGFVAGEVDTRDALDASIREEAPRESFRRLLPEIQTLRARAGIERPDWIAATRGPGSFTGTRISVGAARNLAQLWGIPVRSVSSIALYLYCCARGAREAGANPDQEIAVMIDGKQDRVFAAHSAIHAGLAGRAPAVVDRPPDEFLTALHGRHPEAVVYADDPANILRYVRDPVVARRGSDWRRMAEAPRAVDLRDLCLTEDPHSAVLRSDWSGLVPDYLRMDPATSKFTENKKPI